MTGRHAWPGARPRECRAGGLSHGFQSPSRHALVVLGVRYLVLCRASISIAETWKKKLQAAHAR